MHAIADHGNTPKQKRWTGPAKVLFLVWALAACTAASAWSQNLIANGVYTITSKNSGQVIDVNGGSTGEGGRIDQWPSNGGKNQQWQLTNLGNNYVELLNVNSEYALDVYQASKTKGGEIDQWPYDAGSNQIWQVVSEGSGFYELINKNSGLALDVTGASQTEGTYLDQWTPSNTANQLWSFSSVSGYARYLPVMGAYKFIKGANLPWLDGAYSTYLGVDPHHVDYGVSYNSSSMNAHLADMHSLGITVVRLWLFQDDQGCTLDSNGIVTGVTQEFWNNLDNTVQLAANNHIALYLTVTTGRTDFLENSTLLNAFINNAVIPLTNRYKGNPAVWAFDTMNEIDGLVAGDTGNYTNMGASWAQAQSYVRTVAAAIHKADSGRLVTTSTGYHTWTNLANFQGLGLDFYDFHVYADNGYVPTVSSLKVDKPIYVGESGQGTNEFNDSIQNTAENNFLYNSDDGLYAGLGIWAYQYPAANDIHQMLETNGSHRPVCTTIEDFVP